MVLYTFLRLYGMFARLHVALFALVSWLLLIIQLFEPCAKFINRDLSRNLICLSQ